MYVYVHVCACVRVFVYVCVCVFVLLYIYCCIIDTLAYMKRACVWNEV